MHLKRILWAACLAGATFGVVGCSGGDSDVDTGPTGTISPTNPGPNGNMETAGGGAPAQGGGGGGGASTLSMGP